MNHESDEAFWSNRFHHCALAAGFLAASEGRLADSRYVQRLAYDLYESAAAPGVFVTVERWSDQAALDAHMQSPHVAAAFASADGALAGDVAIHPLTPVAG